ncbi:MAG: sigma-70 family RNA polymerase sigma factor [Lachnospiraceae bacterium]|nr:sigma-70 family RNA polymerase sigma factor [Lachnospiraceae bacterium]
MNITVDKELIQAINDMLSGKEAGFNVFYQRTYDFVFKHCRLYLKDEDSAYDLMQEVYINAYNSIGTLNDIKALPGWLKTMAFRQSTKYLRKQHADRETLLDEEGEMIFEFQETSDATVLPGEELELKETADVMMNIINELPDEQRTALVAYYYDEKSVNEIAEMMGVSKGTILSRLNYARKKLKGSVEDYEKKSGVRLHSSAVGAIIIAIKVIESGYVCADAAAVYGGVCGAVGISGTGAATLTSLEAGVSTIETGIGAGTETVGTGIGISTETVGTGIGAGAGSVGGSVSAATSAVASTSTVAAASGTIGGVIAKVALGVTLAAAAGGGGALLHHQISEKKAEEAVVTTTEVEISEASEGETTSENNQTELSTESVSSEEPTTEEDIANIFHEYLNNTLIAEAGTVEKSKKVSWNDESRGSGYGDNTQIIDGTPCAEWIDGDGIISADICDYDNDGKKEMLIIRDNNHSIELEMYVYEEGAVKLQSKLDDTSLNLGNTTPIAPYIVGESYNDNRITRNEFNGTKYIVTNYRSCDSEEAVFTSNIYENYIIYKDGILQPICGISWVVDCEMAGAWGTKI